MAEIADQLHLSVNTIRTHMRHVYDKLDVHQRHDAIARARALGLLAAAHGKAATGRFTPESQITKAFISNGPWMTAYRPAAPRAAGAAVHSGA